MTKDRRLGTYMAFAEADADDMAGGRFAAPERKPRIVGASPIVEYPRMPDGPWKDNPYPEEPLIDGTGEGDVLGYEIDRPDAPQFLQDSGIGNGPTCDGTSQVRPVVRGSLRRI
jgi:hypothetical protein